MTDPTHIAPPTFVPFDKPASPVPAPQPETAPDEGVSAIEVSFAVPVVVSRGQYRRLADLIDEIARANQPEGHVHWLSSMGDKPTFSQADARFLGKPADPSTPEVGEPTFDSTILHFETCCREK